MDLEVPAHAEIIIEGEVFTDRKVGAAMFGEYTGYMCSGAGGRDHLMRVTCITHRKKPIHCVFLSQMPPSESSKVSQVGFENMYQKKSSYTGIPGFRAQDACMTESMGRVTDRTKERLGVGDTYVIALRRYLLKTLVSVQRGEEPPGLRAPIAPADLNCTDVMVAAD